MKLRLVNPPNCAPDNCDADSYVTGDCQPAGVCWGESALQASGGLRGGMNWDHVRAMSESVDKLKALLFQPESEAIATLSRRIEDVFERAGTTERFQASVATVLDGALREAEVARHDDVAAAIAPLIVKTMKAEIRNSTDDLVEALYPATGRMVKAYVASAIKDLTDEINRRLEANPVMLRLNALTTGRSAGELAIAQSQRLKVEDVLLIRRATGELLARAPEGAAGASTDHVLGGILTAINEFTTEAFKSEGSELRQIDLGDARVYLRVSPAYLLAAKCTGSAPVAAERVFDDEFLGLMDRQHAALEQAASSGARVADTTPLMADLTTRLEARLSDLAASQDGLPRGIKPVPLLAGLIGLPLAAWLAWSAYVGYRVGRVHDIAGAIVAEEAAMVGYPTDIKVTDGGRTLSLSGLAPTVSIKGAVIANIKAALPGVVVNDQLNPVPEGGADSGAIVAALKQDQALFQLNLKAEASRRNVERAGQAMERTGNLLDEAALLTGRAGSQQLMAVRTEAAAIGTALRGDLKLTDLKAAANRIRAFLVKIDALAPVRLEPGAANAPAASDETPGADVSETLAILGERAAIEAKGVLTLAPVRLRLDEEAKAKEKNEAQIKELEAETARLAARLAAIPAPLPQVAAAPRDELAAFGRANAVFFSDQTAFREEAAAARALDSLARIMARDPSLLVRVVGYTDDAGTLAKNVALAEGRAAIVASALASRGVARNQIVTLHRTSAEYNVSPATGTGSANRRVEFEAGFIGEGPP